VGQRDLHFVGLRIPRKDAQLQLADLALAPERSVGRQLGGAAQRIG
jgi:hypothetical protein